MQQPAFTSLARSWLAAKIEPLWGPKCQNVLKISKQVVEAREKVDKPIFCTLASDLRSSESREPPRLEVLLAELKITCWATYSLDSNAAGTVLYFSTGFVK